MRTLLDSARRRLPRQLADRGARSALLTAAGYSDAEIAAVLGITSRTVRRDRQALRQAIIDVLSIDYSPAEIERLGIHVPGRDRSVDTRDNEIS